MWQSLSFKANYKAPTASPSVRRRGRHRPFLDDRKLPRRGRRSAQGEEERSMSSRLGCRGMSPGASHARRSARARSRATSIRGSSSDEAHVPARGSRGCRPLTTSRSRARAARRPSWSDRTITIKNGMSASTVVSPRTATRGSLPGQGTEPDLGDAPRKIRVRAFAAPGAFGNASPLRDPETDPWIARDR